MRKIYRHVFGWFFILLGVLGLFLPFLQGILFLFIGAAILAPEIPLFRSLIAKLEKRYPEIFAQVKLLFRRILYRFRGGEKK